MEIKYINQPPSILNQFIAEIRDKNIQTDPLRFRRNLERIGEIFAYEISKTLTYQEKEVNTPLGTAKEFFPQEQLVIASILRAGIPLHNGLLNYFDRCENAFVSAYRKYTEDGQFEIHIEYISAPDLTNKTVILADPMLATGSSLELAFNALKANGQPAHIHMVSIIASQAGVDYVENMLAGEPVTLWLAGVDEELNAKSYIIPGLGDAGDLAYGAKL
ncbi:uracil phosphoribosyltransferase [Geofilum rubicundum]|uniref:Uracil phosphoribosyltransferase n=1 Tax=Geofilum rubicundum JCM 15548 TaxID=1236989 RepID=A0A0E9LYX2_9BACT|nr:uracil phosphoribosyltransferase [Geofilum rubicundum]GAO30065.1 uracil phosphoribosyltransferase [Geofilum rubicundum JCM 15548]